MSVSEQRTKRRIWPWVVIGAIAAVLALSGGTVTTLLTQPQGQDASPRPTGTAGTSQTPLETSAPPAATKPVPAACTDVYTADYIAMMEGNGYPLNDPTFSLELGTRDDQLGELIRSSPTLRCTWGGASESGLLTNATQVTADQSAAVEARLRELGFTCYPELEGLRCVTQEAIETDGQASYIGESHFLRDDLWLATLWINATPDEYTPGMVRKIWG